MAGFVTFAAILGRHNTNAGMVVVACDCSIIPEPIFPGKHIA
jgi:hypothetical protein